VVLVVVVVEPIPRRTLELQKEEVKFRPVIIIFRKLSVFARRNVLPNTLATIKKRA